MVSIIGRGGHTKKDRRGEQPPVQHEALHRLNNFAAGKPILDGTKCGWRGRLKALVERLKRSRAHS